nr:reverse transcriptase domain-containing protein [Tanacetum cinerariifolium]
AAVSGVEGGDGAAMDGSGGVGSAKQEEYFWVRQKKSAGKLSGSGGGWPAVAGGRLLVVGREDGELKAITTRSGLVTEGPTVPNPPKFVNPEEDECVEETYTDPDHAEYNIMVPPPSPLQKPKPPIQRNFVLHTRDSLLSRISYPSRMLKQKQQEKDDIQIQKFWNMFKQLHLNITLVEALVLMPKYQKMIKALLFNKEKLQKLANTPLNENCSAVILKKLTEKLGDPGKFLIPCGFSELKCKALADLRASINLMPLSVWKQLGLPDLIPTQMTLELANRAICTQTESQEMSSFHLVSLLFWLILLLLTMKGILEFLSS